jgi:DNA invertase Pin-like site-specific DNA recombinase
MANERKILRCAVYARKSSEHGLEQDFNSLDAQREAAEAYNSPRSAAPHCTFHVFGSFGGSPHSHLPVCQL